MHVSIGRLLFETLSMYLVLSVRWRAFIRESYLSALLIVFEGIIRALLVHFSLFLCLLAAQSPPSSTENLMADVFCEISLYASVTGPETDIGYYVT